MKNLFTNLMKNTAKSSQNTGGGASQCQTSRSEGARQITARFEGAQMKNTSLISGCSAVDVPMPSYGAPDEHPMSTRSASDERRWNSRGWKYVAMIFAVLVMSMANIGMAWGDQTWDFTEMSSADKTAYDALTSAWTWNTSNKRYDNAFTPTNGTWTDVISTTITQIKDMKFMRSGSNMGTGAIRIFPNTSGNTDGRLAYNNNNVAFSIPAEKDDEIKITFSNTNSSAQGYVLTNAKRKSDNATTITVAQNKTTTETLVVTTSGRVEFKCDNSKVILYKLVLTSGGEECAAAPSNPSGFSAGTITSTGATFTITDAANTNNYEIYYSTSSTTPESGTTATATTTDKTKAVTGLSSGTTYYAWVRAVCDASHKSSWVALTSSTFTTKAQYTITYNKGANGTGSISAGTKTEGEDFTLSSSVFTRAGYAQTGWATSDGGSKAYDLGGTYSTDAAITLYPVWTATTTYTFDYSNSKSISTLEGEGWTFNSSSTTSMSADGAFVNLVKTFNDNSITTPKSDGSGNDYSLAFAKSTSAYAKFDLGAATTVTSLTGSMKVGTNGSSTAWKSITIKFIGSDGSTVKATYTKDHTTKSWTSDALSYTTPVADVQYIQIQGADKWQILDELNISYAAASCTTSPTVTAGSNSSVTATTAMVSCEDGISSLGSAGCSISSYGFVLNTSTGPTLSNTTHEVGTTTYTTTGASFEKELTGLTAGTTYYVRPYATNGNGTSYGPETSFTTLPSTPTFSPTSGSTVSGSQKITITGHSGSTVYYAWATSSQSADDIYNSGSGSHGTTDAGTASVDVEGGKTLYAISRLSSTNSAVGSASYTVDATAPTLLNSNPGNGDTDVDVSGTIVLTFSENISSVDASKFTLTGATKGAVAIDGSDATKVNIAYSDADNEAKVTLSTVAAAVTDAVGNTSAAFDISFTTVAETSYTVTYNANGGSSAPSNDTGTDITLNDGSGMTGPSGRTTFMGWNTQTDGYGTGYAGGTTDINADLDLYAIWGNTYSTGHVFAHDDSYRIVNGVRKNPAAGAVVTTTDGTVTAISNGSSILKSSVTGLTDVTISGCTSEYKTSFPWLASYIKIPTGQTLTFTVASGYIGTATIYYSGYNKTTTLTNGANSQSITSDATNPESAEGNFTSKTFNLASGTNTFTCSDNNGYISRIEVSMTQLYTLTLDKNNSDASGSSAGSAYVEPNGTSFISGFTAPTRTGYDVEGYYGEAGCTNKVADASGNLQASVTISETAYTNSSKEWIKGSGATLYAKWTPAVYTVTLDANGGTINSGDVTSYTYGVGATLPVAGDMTAPSGAVFLGWYDGATKVISISTTATGNKSYKAKWGYTLYDSYFYQTYEVSASEVSASTLITNAGFPAYMGTNISANGNTTPSSDITTPHDFSALSSKTYYIKAASSKTVTLSGLADVKTVRFYGNKPSSSRDISVTATLVSGTGSDLTISKKSISGSDKIVEASINISGASGYSSSNYYDYTFTFSNDFYLYGIYVEKYTNVPVTGVSLNKSSTTLTAGDTEQLTATISPANATNKGLTWTSNTSAATVSSAGLITAKAAGETTITVTTSDGSYTATCDVTVEAFSCAKFAGKIFDLTVTTSSASYTIGGGTEQNLSSDATIMDDCSAYMGKFGSSTSTGCIGSTKLKLDVSSNNDKYAKITPKCALRNGDVISCTGSSQEIAFSTTPKKVSAPKTSSYSYTVTPGDGLAGASTIYVWGTTSSATVATLTITRPTSYVMTYNPNGGRDEVEAERLAAGANTLTTDVPTRAGYIFKEWNTQVDGEGTGYASGAVYTMPASASELFAKWVEPDYSDEYAYVILTSNTTANTKNATALIGGLKTNTEPPYQLDGNSDYFGITLATNFVAGDKVQFKLSKGSKDGGNIYKGTTSSDGLLTSFSGLSSGDNIYEIDITAAMISDGLTKTLAFVRTSSDYNHSVYWIKVKRKHCVNFMALKEGVTTWSTTVSNWIGPDGTAAAMPGIDDVVYVDKNITVTSNAAKAKDVILGDGKSLTIAPTGGLVVAGTVTTSGGSATTPSDLVILSDEDGTGALITGEESTTTQAGVQFYTKARNDGGYVNQFIGVPLASMTTYNGFYGTALYVYNSTSDTWQLLGNNAAMEPFTAYNLMRRESTEGTLYMEGLLNLPGIGGTRTLNMGSRVGDYLFANSWTAPIDVDSMRAEDFENAEATIYIFNAGTKSDYDANHSDYGNKKHDNPGQWLYMPVSAVKASPEDFSLTVIPSMQAFMVRSNAANARLTLDYKKHVYDPAKTSGATIVPSRAPRRAAAEEDTKPEIVRIRVEGTNGYADDLLLFLREDFSTGYDNGWEAFKVAGKAFAPQLYAITEDGKKAISAQPDAENTVIGFKAGTEDDVYTFTLDYEGNDASLYLYDTYTDVYVRVEKDATYTFLTSDNEDHARFVLTSRNAPSVTTGVGNVPSDQVPSTKARKLMIDGILYIIREGRIYNAEGALVK